MSTLLNIVHANQEEAELNELNPIVFDDEDQKVIHAFSSLK